MSDPRAFFSLPDGEAIDPSAVDAVPTDWATVRYVPVIEAHPDDPTKPILRFVTASSIVAASVLTENGEVLTENGDVLTE